MVQGFTGATEVDLPLPCTYDFEVAAAKYLHALRDGDVPLLLLFSGTVFTRGATGFAVEQVPWDCEAATAAGPVWRGPDGPVLPGHAVAPAGPRHPRALAPLQGGARAHQQGRGLAELLAAARGARR